MPEQEEWRPIAGYPDYQVSSHGRISSTRYSSHLGRTPRIKRPAPNGLGYLKVFLTATPGVSDGYYVHKLVAQAFIGPRPEGYQVCHYDGDPSNNTVGNLRYATRSENERDKIRHGRHRSNWTECKWGHPFDEANTYWSKVGRACRTCRKARGEARRAAARALRAASVPSERAA